MGDREDESWEVGMGKGEEKVLVVSGRKHKKRGHKLVVSGGGNY
jgi:hypothetical protein